MLDNILKRGLKMVSMAQAVGEWEQRQEHKQLFVSNNGTKDKGARWLCSCDNCRMVRRMDKAKAKQDRHLKRLSYLMLV